MHGSAGPRLAWLWRAWQTLVASLPLPLPSAHRLSPCRAPPASRRHLPASPGRVLGGAPKYPQNLRKPSSHAPTSAQHVCTLHARRACVCLGGGDPVPTLARVRPPTSPTAQGPHWHCARAGAQPGAGAGQSQAVRAGRGCHRLRVPCTARPRMPAPRCEARTAASATSPPWHALPPFSSPVTGTAEGPGQGIASRGGGPPSPPQHSGPDSTQKAFPYPHTSPNCISNRQ